MTENEATEAEVLEALEDVGAEEIRDASAVLRKNRELLADLKAAKERAGQLEELARTLGGDEAAADPKAYLGKRAADVQAAEHRARTVTAAVLTKIVKEQRTVRGDLEDLVARILADTSVTVDGDGKVTGLDGALSIAPRRPAPAPWKPPVTGWDENTKSYRSSGATAPGTYEELQSRGSAAAAAFATQSPEVYQTLKAAFEKQLSNPAPRR